jgi:hypothetical protein
MLRITYLSAESYKLSSEDLLSILEKCNENNPRLGLTGMLIYGNGTFIQSIEGEEEIVKNMISKISYDARHKDFKILSEEITEQRLYDEFNMGFERLTEYSISNVTSLKSLSLNQLDSHFLRKNTHVVEDLLHRHRSTHWNPLIQEIEARDGAITEIQTKLAKSMYQNEVLKLALESLTHHIENNTVDVSHVQRSKSILFYYGGAIKN